MYSNNLYHSLHHKHIQDLEWNILGIKQKSCVKLMCFLGEYLDISTTQYTHPVQIAVSHQHDHTIPFIYNTNLFGWKYECFGMMNPWLL